jgi:hypothetical protein
MVKILGQFFSEKNPLYMWKSCFFRSKFDKKLQVKETLDGDHAGFLLKIL